MPNANANAGASAAGTACNVLCAMRRHGEGQRKFQTGLATILTCGKAGMDETRSGASAGYKPWYHVLEPLGKAPRGRTLYLGLSSRVASVWNSMKNHDAKTGPNRREEGSNVDKAVEGRKYNSLKLRRRTQLKGFVCNVGLTHGCQVTGCF